MDNLLQAALTWHRQGFLPIPLRYGTKREPLVAWAKLRDAETLPSRRWVFNQFQGKKNMALLCGGFGNLAVLDFDNMDALHCYEQTNPELAQTYRVATSRGRHLYFKISGGYPRKTFGFKCFLDGHGGNVGVVGEFKGSGYVVAAGRHPTGKVYKAIDPAAPILEVDNARRILRGMQGPNGENINRYICELMEAETAKPHPTIRRGRGTRLQTVKEMRQVNLCARIRVKSDIVAEVEKHTELKAGKNGWLSGKCFRSDLHRNGVDRHPSLWVNPHRQRVGCHSCHLGTGDKSWDVIDLVAWERGISTQEAIIQLGTELSIIKSGNWLADLFNFEKEKA